MTMLTVGVAPRASQVLRDDAALIWAEATAHRDGDEEVASLEEARPLIDAVLDDSPASMLLIAAGRYGRTVGFAAISPTIDGTAEVRYLGVRPNAWGRGVGSALIAAMPEALADAGFAAAVLSVYVDNYRAVALYRRTGWTSIGRPTPHPRSQRLEQRYRLTLV